MDKARDQIDAETARRVLGLPLGPGNPVGRDATVRDYLVELLVQLFLGDASAKRGMTGESDWQYDLYRPLRDAGLIPAWDEYDGLSGKDERRADDLLVDAMRALAALPAPGEAVGADA